MAYLLVAAPLIFAVLCLAMPSDRWRPWLLPLGGLGQFVLVLTAIGVFGRAEPVSAMGGWLLLDPLGKVVLLAIAALFFPMSLYGPGYLSARRDRPNRIFCANLLLALSMMTLVTLSHHLGLMWVAMEATTLAAAPLIYFNRRSRSLEATWKFLVLGSVGIALALFGSLLLAYSALASGQLTSLLFDDLVKEAPRLSSPWVHAAFIFLFVGYGTKMGLSPMHNWKPDAYGEAPGLVGALLAGGVTGCAFLALLRVHQICRATTEAAFCSGVMIAFGLLSMGTAAVFMTRQRDVKRALAYSSVEHMGILVLGAGVGGVGLYGALLHLFNNGLAKVVLFLSAGNIHRAYGDKTTETVRGVLKRLPLSGTLLLVGFFAATGAPPFGPFVSEFLIGAAAFGGSHPWAGGLYLLFLLLVFLGFGTTVFAAAWGDPPEESEAGPGNGAVKFRDHFSTGAPILLAAALLLAMGVWVPAPLADLIKSAVTFVEGPSR